MGQAQVDKDGRLDDRDEDEGQDEALFHQSDNQEDGDDGHGVDHLEVPAGGFDHILHAGGLADEHTGGIVLFQYGIELVHLAAHLIAGHLVLGADQQQFPLAAIKRTGNALWQERLRHPGPHGGFQTQHILHTLGLLHLPGHGPDLPGGEAGVHQEHVGGGHAKILAELFVGGDIGHILRQTLAHVVVHFAVGPIIPVQRRGDDQDEERQEDRENFDNTGGKAPHIGYQGPVAGPLEGPVEHQDQGRQHRHAPDNPQQHALGHDHAQVAAHGESHEAQGDESGNGGDGRARHRGESGLDGGGHGLPLILVEAALLIVAVPEEDGVVHGDGQLKHGRQGLGDIGDLPEKVVGPQVQQDHHPNAGQEHKGDQPAVQQRQHGRTGQSHGDAHIDGLLPLAQVLQIRHQRGHAGDEALRPGDGADLPDGLHGQVRGGGRVEEHGHHGGAARVERVVQPVRQQLLRDGRIQQGVVPQHGLHMVHLLDLLLQSRYVLGGHILQNEEGEGALAKLLQQLVLTDDGLHILGEIVEHVVVDSGARHTQNGREHQRQGDNQNGNAAFDHRF